MPFVAHSFAALMSHVLVQLVCAGGIVSLALQLRRGAELELLPTLAWLLLMALPFLFQYGHFPAEAASRQGWAIALVGSGLVIADNISAARCTRIPEPPQRLLPAGSYRWLVGLFLAGAIVHLLLLDAIPLVEKLEGADDRAVQWMREGTSKLLAVPDFVKYLLNWLIAIVAPVALASMFVERRFALAGIFLAVAVAYASMSLAKLPAIILMVPLVAFILGRLTPRKRRRIYVGAAVVAFIPAMHAFQYLWFDADSVLNVRAPAERVAQLGLAPDDPRSVLSPGDHMRLRPREVDQRKTFLQRQYDYAVYRLFLTPADVSNRWYQFYPEVAGGYAGLQGLTPSTRQEGNHPASKVGNWAYTERFPDKYLTSIRAYASADADANARFGTIGLVCVLFAIIAIRLALAAMQMNTVESTMLYLLAISQFALLLPMASLQAILVANGLLVVLLLMFMAKVVHRHPRFWFGQAKVHR